MVEQGEQHQHQPGQQNAQPYLPFGKGEDGGGAKQRPAHITGEIGGGGEHAHQQIPEGQRTHGNHGNGSVSLDFGILPGAQQQHGAYHRHRQHNHHAIGHIQHRCHRHGTERHMGKAVTDERKPLEHQGNTQQGGTQSNQYPHNQGVTDKGIAEVKH